MDTCNCKKMTAKEIARIKEELPDDATREYLSDFFKVFGDDTRLKMLHYLSRRELCVADLAALAGMSPSAVSHQLKILRLHRLVKFRKEGTTVYYSLDDHHVQSVFEVALEHVSEGRAR